MYLINNFELIQDIIFYTSIWCVCSELQYITNDWPVYIWETLADKWAKQPFFCWVKFNPFKSTTLIMFINCSHCSENKLTVFYTIRVLVLNRLSQLAESLPLAVNCGYKDLLRAGNRNFIQSISEKYWSLKFAWSSSSP